jgi:recombination protein RecT
MATAQKENLPARVDTIRQLLEQKGVKNQLAAAIPKHMTVDRLLRVAMTAIRTNPKLAECTQKSLLACIMGCAQLGLEPEPFLGQAYLVPFKRGEQLECTLIPGYRGYISLARRSGEVQSVSAQVVYENDQFRMQYGLNEALDHVPADGDRGTPKGAYVVFRYKDGSHSFDYMSAPDIEKIRARSKAANSGPWVTDWDEMAKKTVIRRHIKLAPLSVEMARAAALEEKANIGESQVDILTGEVEAQNGKVSVQEGSVEKFIDLAKEKTAGDSKKQAALFRYVVACADHYKTDQDQIKRDASLQFDVFWNNFERWLKQASQGKPGGAGKAKEPKTVDSKGQGDRPSQGQSGVQEEVDDRPDNTWIDCPNETDGSKRTLGYCRTSCMASIDCDVWRQE